METKGIPTQIKAKIRPARDTVICIDITPEELRHLADRLEEGGIFNQTISLFGSMGKEGVELRFMKPR